MKNKTFAKIQFNDYRDKVYACWIGKNIGGTLGGPYECRREICHVEGFTNAPGIPLPNDDLDLQLIWLHAVESLGPTAINAATLGEFWISLITPNWNEYGIGRNNMRRGLVAPISGDYQNSWQNSNGAWIRTEIWACLAPGCPSLAARYAMEDAGVDHGAGEGTVAAAFVAAMQSAAFLISDLRECIRLGLAAIPTETRMADSVRFVLDCYDKGMEAMETRNAILERNMDIGDGWFEAPSNVSYAIIGLLWGQGDFKKSMITAINCGDDTDCTAATVGATLGILGGARLIPEDWRAHVGDDIVTVSINKAHAMTGAQVPKSCTELTDRIVAQAPHTLFANHAGIEITDGENEVPDNLSALLLADCEMFRRQTVYAPFSSSFESPSLIAKLVLDGSPDILPCQERTVTVYVKARPALGDEAINLECRWWLPEGFTVQGRRTAVINNLSSHSDGVTVLKFTIKAGEEVSALNRSVLEISPIGRSTPLYAPLVLLG